MTKDDLQEQAWAELEYTVSAFTGGLIGISRGDMPFAIKMLTSAESIPSTNRMWWLYCAMHGRIAFRVGAPPPGAP
jgi:hypothetical protein